MDGDERSYRGNVRSPRHPCGCSFRGRHDHRMGRREQAGTEERMAEQPADSHDYINEADKIRPCRRNHRPDYDRYRREHRPAGFDRGNSQTGRLRYADRNERPHSERVETACHVQQWRHLRTEERPDCMDAADYSGRIPVLPSWFCRNNAGWFLGRSRRL